MKKIITLSLLLVLAPKIFAQLSCCAKPSSTNIFAILSHDKSFVAAHLEPKPFVLLNQLGKEISFKTPDGKEGHGYEIKAVTPTDNYVFVIHEWWGLNDYIKQESEIIYKTLGNVNIVAIDMYDKKVATTRDSAGKFMGNLKAERGGAIIKGVLTYVGSKAKIATIGWCFGGVWSLQASLLAGKQAKACVMYYGMPEEKAEKLKTLNAPVLFVFAEKDQWINKEVVNKFEANMKTVNKPLEVKTYAADHAFANPSNPQYSKEFSDDAMKNAMEFIRKNLK
jgi:carboxymethylenebutenolidase